MTIKSEVLGAAVLGMVVVGGLAVDTVTAPEATAACYGSVTVLKGKNISCTNGARHWNVIRNAGTKYGLWVGRGGWSKQPLCWANVVSHGMTAR